MNSIIFLAFNVYAKANFSFLLRSVTECHRYFQKTCSYESQSRSDQISTRKSDYFLTNILLLLLFY